jgi:hypothetical protein
MGIGISDLFSGGVEGALKGVKDLIGTFKISAEERAKIQQHIDDNAHEVEKWVHEQKVAELDAQVKTLETVNATMREEAKSEHWAQWLWRPVVGFTFSAILVNNFIVLPYVVQAKRIDIPPDAWLAMLTILGAASAFRGWRQVEEVKKK